MLLFSLDEVDRRQLSEQEKCLETCITKSGACILTAYSHIHVQKISYRQAFNEPIFTADLDN